MNTEPDKATALEAATPADLASFLQQTQGVLQRIERLLDAVSAGFAGVGVVNPDWSQAQAWLYRRPRGVAMARLQPIVFPASLDFSDLYEVDAQKTKIAANTQAFVTGLPANNVLLTGARGTGKSSLVKACLHVFSKQGLRLIEVGKSDLIDLPELVELLRTRPEKFIIYCDDLSFEEGDGAYKALKSVLDGSLAGSSANVLIYATSNRRHLLPEYPHENLSHQTGLDGEMHPGEVVEEKTSLSERFGLWISFYPFSQTEYLRIVEQWLRHFQVPESLRLEASPEALIWALERGSRSGRVAYQFAKDYSAQQGLAVLATKTNNGRPVDPTQPSL